MLQHLGVEATVNKQAVVKPDPGRGARDLLQGTIAHDRIKLGEGRGEVFIRPHRPARQHTRQLVVMVAEQEETAVLVDDAEHDGEGVGAAWAVIRQVTELHYEPISLGGICECRSVAVDITNHTQFRAGRDGEARKRGAFEKVVIHRAEGLARRRGHRERPRKG